MISYSDLEASSRLFPAQETSYLQGWSRRLLFCSSWWMTGCIPKITLGLGIDDEAGEFGVELDHLIRSLSTVCYFYLSLPAGAAGYSRQRLTLLSNTPSLTSLFSLLSFLCLSSESLWAVACLAWKWAHFIFGTHTGSPEGSYCVAFSS